MILALAALLTTPAMAAPTASLAHTDVELLAETAAPAAGKSFTIAFAMKPKKGWHTYWSNPGDSGMPTRAQWTLPTGFTASELQYPTPETYVVSGIMNHVYSHENWLLADITVPKDWNSAIPLRVRLDWLVCNEDICVPEGADLSLELSSGDGAANAAHAKAFASARDALPRPLAETAHFSQNDKQLRLSVSLANVASVSAAHFFSSGDNDFVFSGPQKVERTENALIIEGQAVTDTPPAQINGVLRVEQNGQAFGLSLQAVSGPVATGTPITPPSESSMAPSFWTALGLALLGGLLLNLMPCVFPILSLKALSLARSGESRSAARVEGLAYTVGVVLVTTVLGLGAILIARAGAGAGWAFQLQDPRVIFLLILLTFAIALNFTGLYEINLPTFGRGQSLVAKSGASGAFFTGTLAAFVATPCTGPFMAGALGAALVLPPIAGLAVFAGLGLGLALPFLLIGFIPALRRLLPKPGAWMQTFRRILSVPMLLTALALAWVLGRQAGLNALMLALLVATLLAMGLWVIGLRQQRFAKVSPLAIALLVASLASPFAIHSLAAAPSTQETTEGKLLDGRPYTPETLSQLRAAGSPTFLYFTADWCLTCKVNEKGALSSAEVAAAFKSAGIQTLVGDWTRPDPAIATFLAERQRAGIPLYLYYGADGSVRELPQLLTVDMLTRLASPRS